MSDTDDTTVPSEVPSDDETVVNEDIFARYQDSTPTSTQQIQEFLELDPSRMLSPLTSSPLIPPIGRDGLKKSNPLVSVLMQLYKGNAALYGQDGPTTSSNRHAGFDSDHVCDLIANNKGSPGDSVPLLSLMWRNPSLYNPLLTAAIQRQKLIESIRLEFITPGRKGFKTKDLKSKLDELQNRWFVPEITDLNMSLLGPTLQLFAIGFGDQLDPRQFQYAPTGRGGNVKHDPERAALGSLIGTEDDFDMWGELLSWCQYREINAGCGDDVNGKLPIADEVESLLDSNNGSDQIGRENNVKGHKNKTLINFLLAEKRLREVISKDKTINEWKTITKMRKMIEAEVEANNNQKQKRSRKTDDSKNGAMMLSTEIETINEKNGKPAGDTSVLKKKDKKDKKDKKEKKDKKDKKDQKDKKSKKDKKDKPDENDKKAYFESQNDASDLLIIESAQSTLSQLPAPVASSLAKKIASGWFGQREFWYSVLSQGLGAQMYSRGDSLHSMAALSFQAYVIEYCFLELFRGNNKTNSGADTSKEEILEQFGKRQKPMSITEFGQFVATTASTLFAPISMVVNGIEPECAHLDYAYDRMIGLIPEHFVGSSYITATTLTKDNKKKNTSQQTTLKSFRGVFNFNRLFYSTIPLKRAITCPHTILNAMIGYGLILPPLPLAGRSDQGLVYSMLCTALAMNTTLMTQLSSKKPMLNKITYSAYCHSWLFFSPQLLPIMIKFQQSTADERFELYLKLCLSRLPIEGISQSAVYQMIDPVLASACPNFPPAASASGYSPSYLQNVWDGDLQYVMESGNVMYTQTLSPLSPSQIKCRELPSHQGIPFSFYSSTNNFPDYTIVHESYFYALFTFLVDQKLFQTTGNVTAPQNEKNRRSFRALGLKYEDFEEFDHQLQLKPIITPLQAKGTDLHLFLPQLHRTLEPIFGHHYDIGTVPPSGNVRDWTHSICEIMTAIDFGTTTTLQPNQFCGIFPFSSSVGSTYLDSSRSKRLLRSPLGRPLEWGLEEGGADGEQNSGKPDNKNNAKDNTKDNTKANRPNKRTNKAASAYQYAHLYSPIGLVFKVINAQGSDFAIDELTSILQGITVTQPHYTNLKNKNQNGSEGFSSHNLTEEIELLPPSPFLNSPESSQPYSDITFAYSPNGPRAMDTGWISHTTITASPTSIQIELFLYAILRRVKSSILLVLFNLIPDRHLLVELSHVVETEYGMDFTADPDWEEIEVKVPSLQIGHWSKGRWIPPQFERPVNTKLNAGTKPILSQSDPLDSRILQTSLTLAWCLEVAGTRTYAPDFVKSLEEELAPLGWTPI